MRASVGEENITADTEHDYLLERLQHKKDKCYARMASDLEQRRRITWDPGIWRKISGPIKDVVFSLTGWCTVLFGH